MCPPIPWNQNLGWGHSSSSVLPVLQYKNHHVNKSQSLDNKCQYKWRSAKLILDSASIKTKHDDFDAGIADMAAEEGLEGEEDAGTGQDEGDEAVGDEPVVYGMKPEGEKDQQQASQTDQHQACVSHKDSGQPKNVKLK
jgi:hypothetical protein